MKGKLKAILMMVPAVIIGFSMGIYSVRIEEYFLPNKKVPFIFILLILVVVYFGSVAIHELGHFLLFKLNGVDIRMINIAGISFINNGSKWKVAFNRNGGNVGGIVVPNLTSVRNDQEFRKMQKAYANALLGGPLASFILMVIGVLIITKDSYLAVIGVELIFINAILFLTCFIKMDNVLGDFAAYKVYKNDDFFAGLMMYQYATFAVDYEEVMKNNRYLKGYLLEGLIPRINDRQMDVYTVSCAAVFLEEYITGVADELPEPVGDYIDYYYENYETIIDENAQEANKEFLIYMAYFFEKEGSSDKAIDLYENFIQKLPKSESFDYRKMQSEQIILGTDHSKYLLDKNNIKPNSNYNIFKKLEGFYHHELLLNQRL